MVQSQPGPLSAIGNTPLIRLASLTPEHGAEIWLKWGGCQPYGEHEGSDGALDDRGSRAAGRAAARGARGRVHRREHRLSLAMVCAAKGYGARFVSSDAFAEKKLGTMRAFGAEVEVIPSQDRKVTPELAQALIERARELRP